MRRPERVGIFAIDPGTTTGIDVGIWKVNCEPSEAVANWRGRNFELKGSLVEQSRVICSVWRQFVEECLYSDSLLIEDLFLVVESYSQRPTTHVLEDRALDPVRLAGMVIGYLSAWGDLSRLVDYEAHIPRVHYQSPSAAKTYANDERLKDWEAWIPGPDHRRDARRHALTWWASLRAH